MLTSNAIGRRIVVGCEYTTFHHRAQRVRFAFEGEANNACVTGSPDIDWIVRVTVERQGNQIVCKAHEGSMVEPFPAFEMYATLNGNTKAIFQRPPNPGADPWNLPQGPNQPVSGTVIFDVENALSWQLTGNTGITGERNFLGSTDAQPVVIRTNGAERLRIAANGNIGIGTTQPGAKLEIKDGDLVFKAAAEDAGDIIFSNAAGIQKGRIWSVGVAGSGLYLSGGDNNPDVTIAGTGHVGIGTTQPGNRLSVAVNAPDIYTVRADNTGGGGSLAGVANGPLFPGITGLALGEGAGVHGYAAQTTISSIGVIGTVGGGPVPYLVDTVNPGGVGVLGFSPSTGVVGMSEGTGSIARNGVEGVHNGGVGAGVLGLTTSANGVAIAGQAAVGGGKAGRFIGDVDVHGTLYASNKSFRIDHPLDPLGKYLNHSSIESPEMMNVYNGNVITDDLGEALVNLPDYFEALNRDFRYQLTVIGEFALAIVAREIADNEFLVKTDRPRVKVSWQVTGVRKDPYAEAHPILVEQAKSDTECGRYLHPELYPAKSPASNEEPLGWVPSAARLHREPPSGAAPSRARRSAPLW